MSQPDNSYPDLMMVDTQSITGLQVSHFETGCAMLIDKPYGWSSFRVVGLLRKLLGIKKIGHAGTLDPMATGLLIVCIGKTATRQIHHYQGAVKQYRAEITFGASTPSYDKETLPDHWCDKDHIDIDTIRNTLESQFLGVIQQVPPMYSAIKKGGVALYKLARKGRQVELDPRSVEIFQTQVHSYNPPELDLSITCSKGTYIRSLANDLGLALNSCAHLSALRRTAIGPFHVDDSVTVQNLISHLDPDGKLGISL